jgi:hypothetical protein
MQDQLLSSIGYAFNAEKFTTVPLCQVIKFNDQLKQRSKAVLLAKITSALQWI